MAVDRVLKEVLQLCADVQDGFWQAATHAQEPELAALLQAHTLEWNAFADKVFPLLLAVDHTSPDAKWKANLNRKWMNPGASLDDMDDMDDLTVCDECLLGLSLAKQKLQEAEVASLPQMRELLRSQCQSVENQMATLVHYVQDGDHEPA